MSHGFLAADVRDTDNHMIWVFSSEKVIPIGTKGSEAAQFDCPIGVAIVQGKLVVSDCQNNNLQVFQSLVINQI